MALFQVSNKDAKLSSEEIVSTVHKTIDQFSQIKRALIIHPDYSRHDFSDAIIPAIYKALEPKGLEALDLLNAGGTHRPMSVEELEKKTGVSKKKFPKIGKMVNHQFDDPSQLLHVVDLPASFVSEQTGGHLEVPLSVDVNKMLVDDYDLVMSVSGTVPHEALGYSGGTKIFFPGIAGPNVIALLHWAAVLIGIPEIIGKLDNPARTVVNTGTKHIFNLIPDTPIVSFNMVYSEDENHSLLPKGLFTGVGFDEFGEALKAAAELSSQIHIIYLDEAKDVVVQALPEMYDEVWTAGKGSYKLQRPGVLAEGGEIVLFAPHIDCFHSNAKMDKEMREIGYHGRDYIVEYCKKNPDFNKNVASHMINVRGIGEYENGVEKFPFKVTLATAIPEKDCLAVGLGYRDPKSLKPEDFKGPGKLWIPDGGQWLYARA